VVYTQKDKDFINQKWNQTWNRFREDWDKWEKHTLADYIKEFADELSLQIDASLLEIEKTEISPYLWKLLFEDEKHVSERYIQEILPSEYKRKYSKSELDTQLRISKWDTVAKSPTHLLEQNQFGEYKLNGKEVSVRDFITQPKPEPQEQTPIPLNPITKSIYALEQCGSLLERIAHYMRDNYINNKEILDKAFENKSMFYLDQYAILTNARKEIDERNKWGDYEKILAKFLLDTGESTARIAELLNYSSKYGSIGIDRHGEFVDPQTKEFKRKLLEFLMKCPNCHNNIYHNINENIELYRKGKELTIELPL